MNFTSNRYDDIVIINITGIGEYGDDVKLIKYMEKLIDNHPDVPNFWQQVGLPENWKEHPLWEG